MARYLIIGASSAIAKEVSRQVAQHGNELVLMGRDSGQLESLATDLQARGAATVETHVFDANEVDIGVETVQTIVNDRPVDVVLIAYGTLPDQRACEQDVGITQRELLVNATSVISLLVPLANYFEGRNAGTLAVISSVAGDRGRQSNYTYGAAKGAVSIYLQGLRNRLQSAGVQVLTIKPGFVDTPMTKEFDKGLLWAQPEDIAKGIVTAIEKNRDIAYLPWFWRYIMLIIKTIPEFIFKKLSL